VLLDRYSPAPYHYATTKVGYNPVKCPHHLPPMSNAPSRSLAPWLRPTLIWQYLPLTRTFLGGLQKWSSLWDTDMRLYGSNSSQVTPDPSGMFSSTFPLAVLSLLFSFCWHPCYRGLAVLAGRSLGRRNIGLYVIIIIVICSHVQAILNLRSAIMSWIPLLSALRRIYSLVMWSRYVTCSIRRRHLGWKTFSFCAILDVILHHWPM